MSSPSNYPQEKSNSPNISSKLEEFNLQNSHQNENISDNGVETSNANTNTNFENKDIIEEMKLTHDNKHRLQTSWTIYFDHKLPKPASDYNNYQKNLTKIGSFDTIEDFWSHYRYLKSPEELPDSHNYYLFRENYIPAWETFPNGGCWILKVKKHNTLINRMWEELCFACIGELFEEPDLMGVALSTRSRDDLLSIWNANSKQEIKFTIGEKLKQLLNLDKSTTVEYKEFNTAIRDGSTFRNAKPYVYAASNNNTTN